MNDPTRTENQEVAIDLFRQEDGEGVTALFRRVYGDGYPVKLVYDAQGLASAFEKKENIPVVARTAAGSLVGYEALYRSSPNPRLYEAGQGLVDPAWRGAGLAQRMNRFINEVAVSRLELDVLFGEAVCNHIFMQKAWAPYGNVETALEVDLMPAEAYTQEGSATGRVAALAMFRVMNRAGQTVYLPGAYEEQLRYLYSAPGVEDDRIFVPSSGPAPEGSATRVAVQVFDFAQVARLAVHEAGEDLEGTVRDREEDSAARGVVVLQAWLNLSEPWVGWAADCLRRKGYFLGGLLPRWFGTDCLLMQKILREPNWQGIRLYSERAEKILALVREDARRVFAQKG